MNEDKNKISAAIHGAAGKIGRTLRAKRAGFFVGLVAWILTIVQLFTYLGVPKELFNGTVILCSILGVLLFAVLSLFEKTSSFAPVLLMVCDFLCITSFAAADGVIDYFSTQFFDGFALSKFFGLPVSVWFSLLSFLLSFILSSVAMYLPQNKERSEGAGKEQNLSIAGGKK